MYRWRCEHVWRWTREKGDRSGEEGGGAAEGRREEDMQAEAGGQPRIQGPTCRRLS